MSDFVLDKSSGLASFPALRDFGVRNAVTYDNSIWGNMNDLFSLSSDDKARISQNDLRLADHLKVKNVFVSKTPVDATITHIGASTAAYLLRDELFPNTSIKMTYLHANAIILTVPDMSLVFAPRDCAMVSIVIPGWEGTLIMHIGAHMIMQNLHNYATQLLESISRVPLSDAVGFITPHICPKHYTIDGKAYGRFTSLHQDVDEYFKTAENDRYNFDYIKYMKDSLQKTYGLHQWVESGICNYESAQEGYLFSKRLSDEKPGEFPNAGFNVAFALSSRL